VEIAMPKLLTALLLSLCLMSTAQAAAPSDESLERLIVAMHVPAQTDAMLAAMERGFDASVSRASAGKPLTEAQQQSLASARESFLTMTHDLMAWDKLKPIYLQSYREVFSQEEVDAMIQFYSTPLGQSVIEKQPRVMQRAQALMTPQMMSIQQRLQDAAREASGRGMPPPGK
jgi:hypothetical protein